MSAGRCGAVVRVKTIPGAMVRAVVPVEIDPPFVDGEPVILHADGSLVMGHVISSPAAVLNRHGPIDSLPHVVRRADAQDRHLRQRHKQREIDAFRIGVMKIRERGLAMKLARVEQAFDGSKLVFFFTAEERVDFRELVRELAADYKTRIELRQIGVRDEARMLTGYGTCGRPLCCSTFLRSFDPISIKMAKQQDLALNPARLSGLCGRLKCCLRYELMPGPAAVVTATAVDEAYPGSSDEGGRSPYACGGCRGCGPGGCR